MAQWPIKCIFRFKIQTLLSNHRRRWNIRIPLLILVVILPLSGQDLSEGQAFLDNEQFNLAIKFFSKILETHPNNIEALNGFAKAKRLSGDSMSAIKSYKKSIAINPNQPDVWINIGNIQYNHKFFQDAEFSYQNAVNLEPNNPLAHNNLASVLKEQENLDRAIYHFEKAFEFDSTYGLACRNLGDVYLRLKQGNKAKNWLKTAIKVDPENLYGHYWLGKAYYQLKEFDVARDQFLHVLTNKPNLHFVHHDLGLAFLGMQNYRPAIHHINQAIRIVRTNQFYYLSLSRIYSELQDASIAMAILDTALQYNRTLPEIWLAKGDLNKSSELYEDALSDYKIATSYDRDNWKGYYKQGVVLYYLGRLGEAQSMLEKAHVINSDNGSINHFMGLVFLAKEDAKSAKLFFQDASEKDPVNGDIWFHLGQAYKHLKQFEQARASLENAIGIDSTHAEALYALGQVYTKLDQKEKSQKVLKKFRVVADFEKAEKKLKKQLSLKPSDNDIRRELALLYESRKDFLSAAEIWQQSYFLGDKGATDELERVKEKMK